MPSVPVQTSIVKAVLQTIFDQMDGMFITEEDIYRLYELEMKKQLGDELQPLNMSLQEFMRKNFRDDFNVIDDPVMPSYMRRTDYFNHVSTNRAITGQPNNEAGTFAAPAPPQQPVNGFGHAHSDPNSVSQSRQSLHSTPTPPPNFSPAPTRPVAPQSTFHDAPPGFSQPVNQQSVKEPLMEKLQNQFKDYGLEGVFHPEVLKQQFGDLSELVPDEEENRGVLFNNSSYINGSNISNGLLNLDIRRDKYDHQPPKSKPNIEELDGSLPYQSGAHFETDDYLEEDPAIVESPAPSIYEDSHEQSVPVERSSGFAASRDDFPPLRDSPVPRVESKKDTVQPPPGFGVPPRNTSSNLNYTETPIEREITSKPKRREIPVQLPAYDAGFPIQHSSLFYYILQGSITNSLDVNGFRDKYQQYIEETSNLYSHADGFNWLTGYHLSVNPDTEGYMPNNAFIIDVLQLYAKKYPNGMSPRDLVSLEDVLCGKNQPVCLGRSTNITSVAEMVQRGMLYMEQQVYFVREEILSIKLWKLPPGLTSNLYRILNAQQVTMVQDVTNYTGILNRANGDPVMIHDEDIVRQANMFPLVFTLSAQAAEQQNVRIAKIQLHPKLPRWKVLLDQPSAIRSEVPFHCDCVKCFKGSKTQAVIVPS